MCDHPFDDQCDDCLDARWDAMNKAVSLGLRKFFTELNVHLYQWEVDAGTLHDHIRKDSLADYLDQYVREFEWRTKK
jgi:hypothetical protein